jgi:hypothetical protein
VRDRARDRDRARVRDLARGWHRDLRVLVRRRVPAISSTIQKCSDKQQMCDRCVMTALQ